MLPGQRRIRRADEFRAVMRGSARAGSATLVVHLGRLPEHPGQDAQAPARAGFVVGRSVGGAVARNRVRRRLRHDIAPLLDQVPAGWGVVVRALPGAAGATGPVLRADLAAALRRCVTRVGHGPETEPVVSR